MRYLTTRATALVIKFLHIWTPNSGILDDIPWLSIDYFLNICYNNLLSFIVLTEKLVYWFWKFHGDPIANDCVAAFETRMIVESQILDYITVALIRDQSSKIE